MKVLVINPGATSTKIAVYSDENEELKIGIDHDAADLNKYSKIVDQMPYRKEIILKTISDKGYSLTDFDAICGRGGLLKHIPSGTYLVNDAVIRDVLDPPGGEHASNLGSYLAKELGDEVGIPAFFVDPVGVDEMSDIARYSGMKGLERQSYFHALNHKSVARRAAEQLGKSYEDVNLVVVHLGGGVSVAAHCKGRCIDVNNVRDEGAMGLDRGGSLPVNAIVSMCFSGMPKADIKRKLSRESGVFSYTRTKDFKTVERRAFEEGDEECMGAFKAMAYQMAKDIGSMATVMCFDVDAIVYTGGIAFSDRFCDEMNQYVEKIAPIIRIPGEEEMRALAEGALRALKSGVYGIYE